MGGCLPCFGVTSARKIVGKYDVQIDKDGLMGEGSFSICYVALDPNGEKVAYKEYKNRDRQGNKITNSTLMSKFQRQVEVLLQLNGPVTREEVKELKLWHDRLLRPVCQDRFIKIIDHSRDREGKPGPDKSVSGPGLYYVVTDLADLSLLQLMELQSNGHAPEFTGPELLDMASQIVHAVTVLHAKGVIHLDIKPENFMLRNDRVKLIDLDGCIDIGKAVKVYDKSISFSPAYCAPEFAALLLKGDESFIAATTFDVWATGLTIAELVKKEPVMQKDFLEVQDKYLPDEVMWAFLDLVSNLKRKPFMNVPSDLEKKAPHVHSLIMEHLLVGDPAKRYSLAECLGSGKVPEPTLSKSGIHISKAATKNTPNTSLTTQSHIKKDSLFLLPEGNQDSDEKAWARCDVWTTEKCSLMEYDARVDELPHALVKRRAMADMRVEEGAKVERPGSAMSLFPIVLFKGSEKCVELACADEDQRKEWMIVLKRAIELAPSSGKASKKSSIGQKITIDKEFVDKLVQVKVSVRNRRASVPDTPDFEPVFKNSLWKLNQSGEAATEAHWQLREISLSRCGALVYLSRKAAKAQIYFTQEDMATATFAEQEENSTLAKKNVFTVTRASAQGTEKLPGMDFAPAVFAAESPADRSLWLAELKASQERARKGS